MAPGAAPPPPEKDVFWCASCNSGALPVATTLSCGRPGFATKHLDLLVQLHNQQAALCCALLVPVTPGQSVSAVPVSGSVNRYDQEHDRSFFTFRDPLDSAPPSRAETQQLAGNGKRRVRPEFTCHGAALDTDACGSQAAVSAHVIMAGSCL